MIRPSRFPDSVRKDVVCDPSPPLPARHEDGPAERVLLQHQLHRRRQPIRAAAEVDRAGRDQHAHPRRRCAAEGGDHFIAFNRRSTLPSKAESTPALTRTIALPIAISIAAEPEPASATTGMKSGPCASAAAVALPTATVPNSRRQS